MNFLRQSTAVDIAIGPFIDDDGITPATGLSITQAETRLKKNNGAWAQANDNTTATHEEEGWYEKELDATDTNTVGILIVAVYISGNLAYWKEFQVVEEAVYDAFYAASAPGLVGTAQTGDSFARLGAPAGASVSADIAAIEAQTDDIGAAGAGLTDVPWNAAWDAEVQSEVADALAVYDPPTKAELDVLGTAALATQASVDTVDNFLDTEIAAIKAVTDLLPDGGALSSLATQASVNTIDDFLDTEVAAIKAKTDQLTFTTANQVDATTVTNSDKTGYALTSDFRIKKNTALANFPFVMVDSADHVTPKTGLTITAQRSLDGAAFAACANAASELSNGVYVISLAATDLNADTVTLRFTSSGADDRLISVITQTE